MTRFDPQVLDTIGNYYSDKIREHGASPQGVDWNGADGQQLRFRQLLRIAEGQQGFSLGEVGCGYGALIDALTKECRAASYVGVDLSTEMIAAARERYAGVDWASFHTADRMPVPVDYCVASGIFNVRLEVDDATWRNHIHATLDMMDAATTRGFSFNALTSYSDADRMRDYLYYADPAELFDHCKRHYSRNIALLHDYDLYEFTILVRKAP